MIDKLKKTGVINFLHFVISDLFIKGILFLTLPILTFFLQPSDYGHLSVLATLVTIFAVLFSLNLDNAVTNYYMRKENKFGEFLFSNILTIAVFQIIIITFIFLFKSCISKFVGVSEQDLLWVSFICLIIHYLNVYLAYLQASEQSKKYAYITSSNKILEIVVMILFAYFLSSDKYMSKIYAQSIAIVIFLPYLFYKIYSLCEIKYSFSYVKTALLFGLPLIPHVLSSAIIGQSDRLMINKMLSVSDAGIYSFAYNLGLSITVLIYAWNSMWQPKFYSYYKDNNLDEIKKSINLYSKIISLSTVMIILLMYPLVKFFINEEYLSALKLIPLLLLSNAFVFQYLIYVNYAFYLRRTISISIASIAAAVVNVVVNYIFIPKIGIIAAVLSTFISSLVLVGIHYFNARRVSDIEVLPIQDAFKWFIPLIIFVVFYYVFF